ncbi:uncharacterized protein METZ01_LOCUS101304, partial [marine metagenome]
VLVFPGSAFSDLQDIHSEVHSMCILYNSTSHRRGQQGVATTDRKIKKRLDTGYFLWYIIYVVLHINHT